MTRRLTAAGALPAGRRARGAAPAALARVRARLAPYAFVSPAVLLVAVLLYLPFLYTTYLSFTEYDGLGTARFVGLGNYLAFLDDPVLLTSVRNTLLWVAGTILLPVGLGLAVALLTFGLRGGTLLRLPFLLPFTISTTATGVVWSFLLSSDGALNEALGALGLPGAGADWLQHAPTNTLVMIAAWTWQQTGVNALLFLVGLQSIPKAPVEAARIDGAGGWTLFRYVTWPLLAPLTTVVVGLALVASLKTFDMVWVMTQGGPGRVSETLAVTMYREVFLAGRYGYGASVAVVLTAVTGLASLLYLRRQLQAGSPAGGEVRA